MNSATGDPRLLPALEDAARAGGAVAMATFRRGARTTARIWSKQGGSPVTEADIAIDRLLRERLMALRPGAGWLSEEAEIHPREKSDAPAWIVDPIDGTRSYMDGEPEWGVSIALVADGRPVAACLFMPARGHVFTAAAGAGAWRDGQRLPAPVPAPRVAAGARSVLDPFLALAPGFGAHPKISSLAARIAAVPEGRIAVALASNGCHEWDVAAADLIAAEGGARLTTLDGRLLRYGATPRRCGELIASAESDHDRLGARLAAALGRSAPPGTPSGTPLANRSAP